MKPIAQLARRTSLLLTAILFAAAMPAAAQLQRGACPRIPSVTSDPLNRSYRAGDLVPAELLDPPFAWLECPAPNLPTGATRSGQGRVVFLSVTVDEAGAVTDARPRGAIDPEGYYDAAVAAIRSWHTNRPLWRGASVKASVAVDVRFTRSEPLAAAEPPTATTPAPAAATTPATAPAAAPDAPATAPAQTPAVTTPPPTPTATQPTPAETPTVTPAVQTPVTTPASTPPSTQPATQPMQTAAPVMQPPPAQTQTRTTPPAATAPPASTPPAPAVMSTEPAATPVTPTPAPVRVAEPQPVPMRTEPWREPPVTQPSQARGGEPFTVEYYYKVRWGFAEEFWLLFNRNHWPLLQKQMEMGRILEVRAASPRYHATEDGRWDYRVTIVFRSAAEANAPFDTEALERQLFSDLADYRREEKRRFELLLAHWDVPIVAATLEP